MPSVSICLRAFPAAPLAMCVCVSVQESTHAQNSSLDFGMRSCAPLSLEYICRNTGIIIHGEPTLDLSYPVFRLHHPHSYHIISSYHHHHHPHHVELEKGGGRSWKWHGPKNMQKKTMQQAVRRNIVLIFP